MPTTSAANELTFEEIIAELTEFQEYFTDEDKSKALADWLSEACGIEGKAARLAIRNLAPLVLASLAGTGKVVGKPWMLKLHDKLGEYSWYFNLAQGILNTLKTKTDKTLGEAFEIPSNKNLGKLVSDYARWENLSPEQQGLVQLLLGQNHQAAALEASNRQHQVVISQLSNIIDRLAFDLDLKTPEFLITETEKALNQQAQKSSAAWLTYTSRQAKLIGREHSLELLNDFFDTDKTFSWLVITGDGGTGKSRLALDALLSRQGYCDVGLLNADKLDKSDALNNWQPIRPTIITIDYAAEYPEQIANWIDHFIQHQDDYDFPVRLLILERVAKDQSWWKALMSSSSAAPIRQSYLYIPEPHELLPLTRTEQQQALQSFLGSLDCQITLPEQDNEFWNALDSLSNNGRPLFIGMVASAIEHNDIHKIRNWTQAELLKHVLDREEKRWTAVLSDYSASEKSSIYKLLTIATLSGGFDLKNDEDRVFDILNHTDIANTENELERYLGIIKQLSSNPSGALQPDIFAEYFLLQASEYNTGRFTRSLKKSLVTAQAISPQNTYAVISRTAVDYIKGFEKTTSGELREDITAFKWWKHLFTDAHQSESNTHLEELTATAFNTISLLSLYGHQRTILDNWLPELSLLENSEAKARTLNWKGLIYDYSGQYEIALQHYQSANTIYKEFGDKSGEGTTLNNISHIYHNRGDYETALTYLQQSLDIRQEIGDKSGEGIALNNISLIFKALGDYETALTYLQQSLDIQQEIGNKSGEGTTLNNISQIYDARGDYETALTYLQQSLDIQQEIGDKSGEGTTLNNISQIFKARGDYETALTYLQQSLDITQEIGDKSGEGTTLNNMATTAHARGDYETAITYLQQSLNITQETGDKSVEGATLNNISQIYDARGDYETALKYLQQSLDIREEIGDIAGLCATKFNIGHIQWQNEQHEEAFKSWASVYQIAKEIGYAQVLEALTSLAEQLELPNGVEGWEIIGKST